MNHPSSAFGVGSAAPPPPPLAAQGGAAGRDWRTSVEQLLSDLTDRNLRENALLELSKKRDIFHDLAPLLWHSFGSIAALLQEIISIYPYLSPPTLSSAASNRVCNALALLQSVASHSETRVHFLEEWSLSLAFKLKAFSRGPSGPFLFFVGVGLLFCKGPLNEDFEAMFDDTDDEAHIPLYLYPFLNTTSKTRPFEYLRLTSLGVIGALVKVDETEVIGFLLRTEIIPLCLRTMEMGSELSKTVATFIVQKILLDDVGLNYICATKDRFYAVGQVLGSMVTSLAERPSVRLLKHIIRCYLRLSEHRRACEHLINYLPDILKDGSINSYLHDDPGTRHWLQQLLHNVNTANPANRAVNLQGGLDHIIGS